MGSKVFLIAAASSIVRLFQQKQKNNQHLATSFRELQNASLVAF
jgi:hypothetical protein